MRPAVSFGAIALALAAALAVSFGLSLYALLAGVTAALSKGRRLADSARNALVASFFSTAVASVVLALALVRHDFSFAYVAAHTSRDLSAVYALSAFWGGQEGSLLLWLLVLAGYGALAVMLNRTLLRDLILWVVPVIGGVATFFSFVLVTIASPFRTQVPALDGAGLAAPSRGLASLFHRARWKRMEDRSARARRVAGLGCDRRSRRVRGLIHQRCTGSIHLTVSGFSIGSMSRLTAVACPSLRTSTHSSVSLALALIS